MKTSRPLPENLLYLHKIGDSPYFKKHRIALDYPYLYNKMELKKTIKTIKLLFLFLLAYVGETQFLYASAAPTGTDRFTLVIDAGHGGKDPGAIGRFSREKNINLSVAKAFGKLVEENWSGRKSDLHPED